ncbi:MAG: EH signature domain-containing protein [Phocaeicola sp.]
MDSLKKLFNIDFSADLYIRSADSVVPNWLVNNGRKRAEQIEETAAKYQRNKLYVPDFGNIDTIKQMFSFYKRDNKSIPFSTHDLKKISYYPDQIVNDISDYELIADLFDKEWKDKYLHGFIYFMFSKWSEIEYNPAHKGIKDFILNKVVNYNGQKSRLLKLKDSATYLKDGGATKFGKMLKSSNTSILLAPTLFGLKEGAIMYSFFSKVILAYYHKDYDNYKELDSVLSRHNSVDTNKIVLSERINYINEHSLTESIPDIKSLSLKHIGDPAAKSLWGTIGFNEEAKDMIEKAHQNINRWMIQMYIDVVFSTMIEDPKRREFWMKYIDHITSFKVIGSPLNKQRLQANPLLEDSLQYYFKQTFGERTKKTCSMLIEVKSHYFIEFSDLGSLYVYEKSNSEISRALSSNIDKIDDLKTPHIGNLVEPEYYRNFYNSEGRMVHRGHWQARLTSWFKNVLMIYVD